MSTKAKQEAYQDKIKYIWHRKRTYEKLFFRAMQGQEFLSTNSWL